MDFGKSIANVMFAWMVECQGVFYLCLLLSDCSFEPGFEQ